MRASHAARGNASGRQGGYAMASRSGTFAGTMARIAHSVGRKGRRALAPTPTLARALCESSAAVTAP